MTAPRKTPTTAEYAILRRIEATGGSLPVERDRHTTLNGRSVAWLLEHALIEQYLPANTVLRYEPGSRGIPGAPRTALCWRLTSAGRAALRRRRSGSEPREYEAPVPPVLDAVDLEVLRTALACGIRYRARHTVAQALCRAGLLHLVGSGSRAVWWITSAGEAALKGASAPG